MIKRIALLASICLLIFACEKTSKPLEKVVKPVISPEAGEYLQEQTIEIECETPDAQIYYTMDGADPTESSTLYDDSFTLNASASVKAKAFKEGMEASDADSVAYTFRVSSISIAPIQGTYTSPINVNMYFITPGTTIYYTTDGSEPNLNSQPYTGPFLVDGNVTIKAKGFLNGWISSETRSVTYSFTPLTPSMNVIDDTYFSPFNVSISTATANTTIRYTTDGSEPTSTSNLYTGPVYIAMNTVLKAKAFKLNWNPSATATGNYILKAIAPVFNPGQGNYTLAQNVTITTSTAGAEIRYTLDGSIPDANSALYTAPVAVEASGTLKAIAMKTGWESSGVTSGNYNFSVTAPTFDPAGGEFADYPTVTISCVTPQSQIRYTTDGTDPNITSQGYINPIEVSSSMTIKAKAYRTGWSTSTTTSAIYTITSISTVQTPVISPAGGAYTAPQSVSITCGTPSATIRYTTDGTDPTQASEAYSAPLSISHDATVKARAFRSGWYDSNIATSSYQINFTLGAMINVPAGTFTQGRTTGAGESDELPLHEVTISAFTIGKYEVTQFEWVDVMGTNPSFYPGDMYRPVESVNWYAAVVYCNRRSIQEGLTPCFTLNGSTDPDVWGPIPTVFNTTWNTMTCDFTTNGYRLPTEAEWEYAARGASNTPDYIYSGSNNADLVAWYRLNANGYTQIVGHLDDNGLQIHDMSGNVNEWCWDWYSSTYYTPDAVTNPTGPATGSYRIARGGDCNSHTASLVRIVDRDGKVPYYTAFSHGLRVVRSGVRY